MELYLVRHGVAEDSSTSGRDADRQLTPEGQEKTAKVAKSLHKRVDSLDLILHSPYARARETAEIFAAEFAAPLEQVVGFRPGDSVSESERILRKFQDKADRLMVVSHEPHLGSLASYLLTGSGDPVMAFKKAGVACLDWPAGGLARLLFLLAPKFLAVLLALFALPAFADDERHVLDLYNQTERELQALGAPPFSSLCALDFPNVHNNGAICEDLHAVACKDAKGGDKALADEMQGEIDKAREAAAKAMGFSSYADGARHYLTKNEVNLPKGQEAEAVKKLLDFDSGVKPEEVVAEFAECKAAGRDAPAKLRSKLVELYSGDLPSFLKSYLGEICPLVSGEEAKKHPRELNQKVYATCENFAEVKQRVIELHRKEGSDGGSDAAKVFVDELYVPALVAKKEPREKRAKRFADSFCVDYGKAFAQNARDYAAGYAQNMARSEPVVRALIQRYYNERNRVAVDAMIGQARKSILGVVERLSRDDAKRSRIRAEYGKIQMFWIS